MSDKVILIQEEPRGPSELVEVPVTASGLNRVAFPDNQQLRSLTTQSVVIKQISAITPDVLTNGPITGFVASPVTEMQKAVLVIYSEGWEKGHYIPLLGLNPYTTPGVATPHAYNRTFFSSWKNVDWSKSYILYANGTASDIGAGAYAFLFDVVYERFNAAGQMIIGPN